MTFSTRVYEIVSSIPEGCVMTYGQVASMLGNPRQARAVGWVLRGLTINERIIPWWRVINSKGYISINQNSAGVEKEIQRDLLRDEGVEVSEQYEIDLGRYLFNQLA